MGEKTPAREGSVHLKCVCKFCGKEFTCSNHCHYSTRIDRGIIAKCLCYECDNASEGWKRKCNKDNVEEKVIFT